MNPKTCALALEKDLDLAAAASAIRNECSLAIAVKTPRCLQHSVTVSND